MKAALIAKPVFELENSDIDDVQFNEYGTAFDEINEALLATIQDDEILNCYKETYDGLKDIIDIYVDEDEIYVKLETEDMDDTTFIKTYKPLLEEIIIDSDTSSIVEVAGNVTSDSWNYLKGEYQEETSYEVWDETITLTSELSNFKVKKED